MEEGQGGVVMKALTEVHNRREDKQTLLKERNEAAERVRRLKRTLSEVHGPPKRPRVQNDCGEKDSKVHEPLLSIEQELRTGDSLVDMSYESDTMALCTEEEILVWRIVRYDSEGFKGVKGYSQNQLEDSTTDLCNAWGNVRASLDCRLLASKGLRFREAVLSPDGNIIAARTATVSPSGFESLILLCARTGEIRVNIELQKSHSLEAKRRLAFVSTTQHCQKTLYMLFVAFGGTTLRRYIFYDGYRRLRSKNSVHSPKESKVRELRVIHGEDGSPLICLRYDSEVVVYSPHSLCVLFSSATVPGVIRAVCSVTETDDEIFALHCLVSRQETPKGIDHRLKVNAMSETWQCVILSESSCSWKEERISDVIHPVDLALSHRSLYILEQRGHIHAHHLTSQEHCCKFTRHMSVMAFGDENFSQRSPNGAAQSMSSSASTQPPEFSESLSPPFLSGQLGAHQKWTKICSSSSSLALSCVTKGPDQSHIVAQLFEHSSS